MATDEKSPGSRRILFLTNVDLGEANTFLATSYALFQADPDVEIHLATFDGLEESIISVSQDARLTVPQAKPIIFHQIEGLSMGKALKENFNQIDSRDYYYPDSYLASPSFSNTPRAIQDTMKIFVPYTGPQLVKIVMSIEGIIKEVDADLVVVDSLMTAGLTACYYLGVKFTCLSPNAIKEFARPSQPGAVGLWKFPVLFSGFPYPVPWHLIPLNIYYFVHLVRAFTNDNHKNEVTKYLASQAGRTLRTPIDLLHSRPADLKILVSTLPELDFPLILPSHVFPCGPIIRHAPPISESDPELGAWLAKAPTVYVNLGSLFRIAENQAIELAHALRIVLDTFKKRSGNNAQLQVFWKLKRRGDYKILEPGSKIHEIFEGELKADIVRIVDWFQTEPIAILQTGHVVCSVHHGGANSYNEAVLSGIPHVVLPQWTDCYEYVQRVEFLGIGRWGSRTTKPQWTAEELSRELLDVLLGKQSDAIKQKAKHLAEICQRNGNGADNAAKIILGECSQTGDP